MNIATMCVGCMDNDTGDAVCPKCGSAFDLPAKNSLQLKPRTMLRDQYLIGRALGHGGFGITYLAWDIGLEARLAVKEYMPNGVAGRASGDTKVSAYSEQTKQEFEWGLDRFLDEARTLKKFSNHPGIVSVDTIFRENGTAYLVMEFLDGWTLEDFLRRRDGKVSFETALRILTPVLDALTAVHAEGILHRDISPDNIYLTRAGKVKLIDFGAARNALSQKSRNLSIILKEGYAPEEQYRASGIQGPWTDVYATAATFYHAVTGQIPQPALDRMAEDRVQAPSQLGTELEGPVELALMKALAIKAQDRFQSAEDFKGALNGNIIVEAPPVIDRRPPPFVAPPAANLPPPPARISEHLPPPSPPSSPMAGGAPAKPRWIWAAALAVVAVGAATYVATRNPVPDPTGASGASGAIASSGATGASDGPTGPTATASTGPTGETGAPTGPTAGPTGPSETPVGPTGTPTGATGGGPTGPSETPVGPTGRHHGRNVTPPQPTGAPGGQTGAAGGATGPAAGPTGPSAVSPGPGGDIPPPGSDFTTPPSGIVPPGPGTNPGGGDYNSLMQQAKSAWSANQFAQVQQILTRAIQMDPSNPRAYSGLGELNLYVYNNVGAAMQNNQQAIAHGGEAVFHVIHDHSAGSFVTHCRGFLRVSAAGVRYQPADVPAHAFNTPKAQIREARNNHEINLTFGHRGRPSVDLHAFHIRLADGQNFNFAPQSRSGEAERQMILNFVGAR